MPSKRFKEKMKNYKRKIRTEPVEYDYDTSFHLIRTNKSGYLESDDRDFIYNGDRYTWVKVEGEKMTIKRAAKGIISTEYTNYITNFCKLYGVDFDAIAPGETVTIFEKDLKK